VNLDAIGVSSLYQASREGVARALLVVLHGRGDSYEGFSWLAPGLKIPGLAALLLNAPDPYYTGYSWYDLPPHQLPGIQRSRKLMDTVFNELRQQGFPPEKCILLGFSQGCLMTLEFGSRFPHRLAGYVGLSGYCYDEKAILAEAHPVALSGDWLITHGTRDEVLDIEKTRSQIAFLRGNGFEIDYREYEKAHVIDLKEEFSAIREWISRRVQAVGA